MKNPGRTQLADAQHDPAELARYKSDPLAFYNRFIRQEGEKVLDKKEFDAYTRAIAAWRKNHGYSKPEIDTVTEADIIKAISTDANKEEEHQEQIQDSTSRGPEGSEEVS